MTITAKEAGSQAVSNGWAHYEGWLLAWELDTCAGKLPTKRVEFICDALGVNLPDNPDSHYERSELARDYIRDSALSVEVKSGWQTTGQELVQQDFRICFTTGGPSLYLQGELDQYDQPTVDVRMYCGHWGEWAPLSVDRRGEFINDSVLNWVAGCFYFGG